ncbi:MAG: DUF3822 family protein [Prevotella sp.]|nr:DUF3822 family protein [Prevotella sp.]
MPGTGNNIMGTKQRLTIRISNTSLLIAVADPEASQPVEMEPFTLKSGISISANMREAFKSADLLQMGYKRVQVLIDAPVLMIPTEMFNENDINALYYHSFPELKGVFVLFNVLPDLNAVAVFSISKDLKMVIEDNIPDVKYIVAMAPVWRQLHQRSYTGARQKLYGYFHDSKLDIFSFKNNRFRFCNSFNAKHSLDALYFLLYVWKQTGLDVKQDEMHLVGNIPDKDLLTEKLREYLRNAYIINPVADYNRAPATQIKGMTYDMMTLLIKGR